VLCVAVPAAGGPGSAEWSSRLAPGWKAGAALVEIASWQEITDTHVDGPASRR